MKLGIIHFSDIHIKGSITDNQILLKTDKIILSLQNKIIDFDKIFIIVSGDIAFSGKKAEYLFAYDFLIGIKTKLEDYSKKEINIIAVPGNHDCNFDVPQKTRDLIINGLESQNYVGLDDEIISQCCKPQQEYFEFQSSLLSNNGKLLFQNELVNIIEFQDKDFSIILNCFNTSWTSLKVEKPGKIAFPITYFNEEIFENQSSLKVNIIHHPLNWQSISSYRDLRRFLNTNGDITLSGHEHQVDITKMVDHLDNSNTYLESGALQDSDFPMKSYFNLVYLDLLNNTIKVDLFEYKNGAYSKSEILKERQLLDISKKKNIQIPINSSFSNFLDSPNAQFLHKRAEALFIDDLFVNPYLKTIDETSGKAKLIDFNEILNKKPYEKIIIVGEDGSGKTTLCKKIFKEYHVNGFIPVFIKGSKIEKSSFDYIFNILIKEAFVEQYSKKFISKFDEIDKSKIVIIIDDFQACKLKDTFRKAFATIINDQFKNSLYTSDSMLYFNPVAEGDGQYAEYKMFTILEFSYERRYELIKKWNSLGETELFGNGLQRKNECYDKLVKNFLGNNFLPQYPFIIITALQSVDFSSTSEQGFSYYYKFLIEESLKKNIRQNDDLLFYNYFLAEYCFFLFNERIRTIHKDSFERFFKEYIKRKKVSLAFKDAYSQLINSKTIKCEGEFISLTYNYIYYYYVASYLAGKIDDINIKELIKRLIDRLYVDEYSGIIIFLTQISSSQFIIDTVKNHADEYYKDYAPATLSNDIEKIDGLLKKIPELIFVDKNIEERRKVEIEKRLIAEEKEKQVEEQYLSKDYDLNNDLSTLSLLNVFIRSVKTFEIFGQIIKKNWGAYDGDVKEIFVNTTFDLSMRILSAYFTLIQKSADDIIDHIYYIADKREITEKRQIEKLAESFIFNMAYVTSYGIIKRLSNSISHTQLKETFDDVVKKNPSNANKLIRLSIIMDHFGILPNDEISILFSKDKKFNKYFLPKVILQNFIFDYLHMYEVPYNERNRICSISGIKIKEQRAIQEGSKEMK